MPYFQQIQSKSEVTIHVSIALQTEMWSASNGNQLCIINKRVINFKSLNI